MFFKTFRGINLLTTDRLKFLNLGYLVILLCDVMITLGTIFKLSIEFVVSTV